MTPNIDPRISEQISHFAAVMIIVAIALFLLWLVTIIDIVSSQFTNNTDKIVWFFFVMLVPPIGILLYFIIGRYQKSGMPKKIKIDSSTRYRDIGRE
jgi:hypothetical protein